jgi:hypothetical protein
MNFFLLPLLSQLLQPLVCTTSFNGELIVASRPEVPCRDKEWYKRLPTIIILTSFYGIILPLIFFIYLFFNRHRLHSPEILSRFGSLILPYKSEYGWWEVMVVLKKFTVSTLPSVSSLSTSVRVLVCIIVIITFVIFEQLAKPFKDERKGKLLLL